MADEYIGLAHQSPGGGAFQFTLLYHNAGTLTYVVAYHVTPNSGSPPGGQGCDFSPDGDYVALAASFTDDTLVLLHRATPTTLVFADSYQGAAAGQDAKFSPDGAYIAHCSSDLVLVYHDGAGTLAFADSYNVGGAALSAAWSPSGDYLAVGSTSAPHLTLLYHDGAGTLAFADTFDPNGDVGQSSFTSDGLYLVIPNFGGNDVRVLYNDGGTLSQVSQYSAGTLSRSARFSPDDAYIARAGRNPPRFTLFEHGGDGTFSLADTYTWDATVNNTDMFTVGWNAAGTYIGVGGQIVPRFALLYMDPPGTVSYVADYTPSGSPAGVVEDVRWVGGEEEGNPPFNTAAQQAQKLLLL